jgi:hypothetical protein
VNPWQMAQQIQHVLSALNWAGGGRVFGPDAVVVSIGQPEPEDIPHGTPAAVIVVGSNTADEDHPADLVEQQFAVLVLVDIDGDMWGEQAALGAGVPLGGQTRSEGRGVLELEPVVVAALSDLYGADGASLGVQAGASQQYSRVGEGSVVAQQIDVRAWCFRRPYYEPPSHIALAGGVLSWRGVQCSSRFDFVEFTVTVNGTPVYDGTDTSVAIAANPGDAVAVLAGYGFRPGDVEPIYYSTEQVGAALTVE